jgi:hypothetical protein
MNYTPDCTEDCTFTLEPVPGAQKWPRRVICRAHGFPNETRSKFTVGVSDPEKSNHYATEVASPADILERPDGQIESQY